MESIRRGLDAHIRGHLAAGLPSLRAESAQADPISNFIFSYAERASCNAERDTSYADPADSYASKVELLSNFIADLLQSCVRSC